ncbi:glutamate--tRNA ligase [Wohlfahrtiimonas larvae]|uniref:Glutamate--tRNA ligase n=2 Tax=Wohlfahrtiimonas larvae TaxID=1157986 RepID=A0ABP9MU75_9GAMM
MSMKVRTRFAPSPTGFLHIGGARTALYSCLYALHNKGETVLRIEDTDLERSTPEAVEAIIDGLDWLGLHFNEGPFYQTKRFDRYKEVIAEMLEAGTAYYCYCTQEELQKMRDLAEANKEKPRYNGMWRPEEGKTLPAIPEGVQPVVRFRNPETGVTSFDDLVHGTITFQNTELDDLIIARPDGTPTYNFCVVIDDMDMGITHVVRGDDHINNTPRQINILKALNAPVPAYAHVAMILGDDGQKLSKRHGAVSVTQYRDEGYLPEAVLNYLIRLGWSHGDQEIFSWAEMIELFDLKDVNKAASAFNTSKLLWLNQHYMVQKDPAELAALLVPYMQAIGIEITDMAYLEAAAKAHVARCQTMVELAAMIQYLYVEELTYDEESVEHHLTAVSKPTLIALRDVFAGIDDWSSAPLKAAMKDLTKTLNIKMGQIGMPLRTAIVGRAASPNLDETLILVGKDRTLARLEKAIEKIG